MPHSERDTVISEIVKELEGLKNLYPYSNNNQLYNSVIDLCIDKIHGLKENPDPESKNPIDEQKRESAS